MEKIHENVHVFVLLCYMYMKAQKHARFHVFSPTTHYIIIVNGLVLSSIFGTCYYSRCFNLFLPLGQHPSVPLSFLQTARS